MFAGLNPPRRTVNKYWITNNTIFQYQTTNKRVGVLDVAHQQPSWTSGRETQSDGTERHVTTSDTNDGFFNRPVKIANFTWMPGQKLYEVFNPWSLFCEDPRVVNRLAHFKNLKMKLNVQVLINGNPFYYGRGIMSYTPLHRSDQITTLRQTTIVDIVEASQRPHVYLDPCKSEGGEIELPFIFPKPFLDIPTQEWRKMGQMVITSINALGHANGGTEPITMTVFAYASDVELNTPTSRTPPNLQPQGEYGMVSMPASTIASISKRLADTPVIGKFMKATNMISQTVSDVAIMFGYSRPRMIPTSGNLMRFFGESSVTDFPDTSVTCALSAKKELTIDPRVVGLAPHDEMALVPLAMRESYIDTFTWNDTKSPDAHLYSFAVTPVAGRILNGVEHHVAPMSWVSLPFTYWKGSIEVRLQVVSSAYHRGRLRIVWDPDFVTDPSAYNVNYSMLLDISESTEATLKIGWGQSKDYLPVPDMNVGILSQPRTNQPASILPFANGTLSVYVVNPLTSPSEEPASIQMNVFVRACDDFEVAVPKCGALTNVTPFINPVEPDPEDGSEVFFANPAHSMWGLPVNDVRMDVFANNQALSVDTASPKTYYVQGYFAQSGVEQGSMTLKNGGAPLGMDIVYRGVRYPFNMSNGETKNFTFEWPVSEGWNEAVFFFDVDNFAFENFEIQAITSSKPTDTMRVTMTGENLEQFMTPGYLLSEYTPTEKYITHLTEGSSITMVLPPETKYGQQVIFTMTTASNINGSQFDVFSATPRPPTESYIVSASVPLDRKFKFTKPDYLTNTQWSPQINSVSFFADADFVPQGDTPEERNQDSDTANAPEAVSNDVQMAPSSDVVGLNEIYFGEVVSSWRQVLKRFVSNYNIRSSTNTNPRVMLPQYPFQDIGLDSTQLTVSETDENMFKYVSSAYVCMRGSTRIKIVPDGTNVKNGFHLSRTGQTVPAHSINAGNNQLRWCGTAADVLQLKPYAEFELPVYSNLRFTPGRNFGPHTPSEFIERTFYFVQYPLTTGTQKHSIAYAAAEDFALYFFLCTPVLLV